MCNAARSTLLAVLICYAAPAVGDEFEIGIGAAANARFSSLTKAEPNHMASVVRWISAASVLPSTVRFPEINIIPLETIASHRRSLAGPGLQEESRGAVADGDGDILAFYDRNKATIYHGNNWTGDNPVEMSILVHEMVHHMEAMAEIRGYAESGGERLAYALQDRWLKAHGTDLKTAFGIDPFSVTTLTEWLY